MRAEDADEAFSGLLGAKQIMIIALTEVGCGGSWHLFKAEDFNPSVATMGLGKASGTPLSHTDGWGKEESLCLYIQESSALAATNAAVVNITIINSNSKLWR